MSGGEKGCGFSRVSPKIIIIIFYSNRNNIFQFIEMKILLKINHIFSWKSSFICENWESGEKNVKILIFEMMIIFIKFICFGYVWWWWEVVKVVCEYMKKTRMRAQQSVCRVKCSFPYEMLNLHETLCLVESS